MRLLLRKQKFMLLQKKERCYTLTMNKFQNKKYVNSYRKKRRETDPVFRKSEKKARKKYIAKRKEAEEACPELLAERRAKKASYMKEYRERKKKEAYEASDEGWLKSLWEEL